MRSELEPETPLGEGVASRPLDESPGQRGSVMVIVFCHFVAAFAALGMPPFFGLILDKSLHSTDSQWVGWLFIIPTFFAALSTPWWGILADRIGRKKSLLRAQLGLALSFLLISYASNPWEFAVILSIQGLLGGTFAASNAYLASLLRGPALIRGLTMMQGSARAALLTGPIVIGLFVSVDSPILLYRYLALLPLLAALLLWWLPPNGEWGECDTPVATRVEALTAASVQGRYSMSAGRVFLCQFVFIFSTVASFPYFVPYMLATYAPVSTAMAGFLFGLPHLIYLVCAAPLSRFLAPQHSSKILAAGFLLTGVTLLAQMQTQSLIALMVWRVVMGLGMTCAFIALNGLAADIAHSGNAGRIFGFLESGTKWGAVLAGLCAGASVPLWGLEFPFLMGGVAICLAGFYLRWMIFSRSRVHNA